MPFIDNLDVDGTQRDFLGADSDRYYGGTDLSAKFANEIKGYSDEWAWMRARIRAANFSGIHINDYIPVTCTNGTKIKACVAGIDTYYKYGDSQQGHHIDFISRDLWPTLHVMNPANFNNGLVPVETMSGDGTKTVFVLTKQMGAVNNIMVGGVQASGFSYDADTFTVTFDEAPASGTNNIVVTGTGTEYPWLASELYAYANSLKMQVPNGTSKDPAVKMVDYTNDGIFFRLPQTLKNVIVNKRGLLPKRYSASGLLSSDNGWGWENLGNLWVPSEVEVYGCPMWGNTGYGAGGFVQYPVFSCNMNRIKGLGDGGGRYAWWLLSACAGSTSFFAFVTSSGIAAYANASLAWVGLPVCFRIS